MGDSRHTGGSEGSDGSWLDGGCVEVDQVPRPPETNMLAAHGAVTTNSRKAQQKLGKLVNQGRHVAHKPPLDQLPEMARPLGPDDPLGGSETRAFAKAGYRSRQEAGATACLRARPTDSLRVIPASEFVRIGRRFMGIDEHVVVRCPCCDGVNVGTRHIRICARAGAQVHQYHPLLHAISRALQRLEVPHQVESGEFFTADRNLRMNIVVWGEAVLGMLRTESTGRSPSRWTSPMQTHKQAQVHVRGGSADHDGSAASTSDARKHQHNARPGYVSFDERSHKLATLAVGIFGRFGVEGSAFIDQLAANVVGGKDGGSMRGKVW